MILLSTSSTIPVVWSPETRRHEPMREVWVGVPTAGTEVPERVDRILDALRRARRSSRRRRTTTTVLRAVHDPGFVEYLARSTPSWAAGPYDELVGQDRVVPYFFPTPALTQGMPPTPAGRAARPGRAVRATTR